MHNVVLCAFIFCGVVLLRNGWLSRCLYGQENMSLQQNVKYLNQHKIHADTIQL